MLKPQNTLLVTIHEDFFLGSLARLPTLGDIGAGSFAGVAVCTERVPSENFS